MGTAVTSVILAHYRAWVGENQQSGRQAHMELDPDWSG